MEDVARRLEARRAQLGLSGTELARRAGLDYKTLNRLLSGEAKRLPHAEQFVRLCAALALTPHQALGVDPAPPPDPGRRRDLDRLAAALAGLDDAAVALAADLIDTLARHRGGG
jgi:transcriptional regulator with XRE-family HTH domain